MPDPTPCLTAWRLSTPVPLKLEGHAHVWRVTRAGGRFAALKIFRPGQGGNERNAAARHRRYAGGGLCPAVLEENGDAVLYDWAPGRSLGDRFRAGAHDTADTRLGRVMAGLLARAAAPSGPFASLADHTRALAAFTPPPGFSAARRACLARDKALHAQLIVRQNQEHLRLFHGDLHHDSVLGTDGTWAVIDPQAIVGDVHFEPANAFRNPSHGQTQAGRHRRADTGGQTQARDPGRINWRADLWAATLDLDRTRLLQWAAAKCAVSIAWSCRVPGGPLPEDDLSLLPVLLAQLE